MTRPLPASAFRSRQPSSLNGALPAPSGPLPNERQDSQQGDQRLIHKSDLVDLLNAWKFNPHDRACLLELAPSFELDGQVFYHLPVVERLLARAYWVGNDAARSFPAAA